MTGPGGFIIDFITGARRFFDTDAEAMRSMQEVLAEEAKAVEFAALRAFVAKMAGFPIADRVDLRETDQALLNTLIFEARALAVPR